MNVGFLVLKLERSYVVDLDDKDMIELAKEWLIQDLENLIKDDPSYLWEHIFKEGDYTNKLTKDDIEEGLRQYREELNEDNAR